MKHVCIDPFLSPSAEKSMNGSDRAAPTAPLPWPLTYLHQLNIYDDDYLKHHTNAPYLIGDDGVYVRDVENHLPLIWDSALGAAKPFDSPGIGDFALEGEFSVNGLRARPAFVVLKEHLKPFSPE
jgi:hypothetical protein